MSPKDFAPVTGSNLIYAKESREMRSSENFMTATAASLADAQGLHALFAETISEMRARMPWVAAVS